MLPALPCVSPIGIVEANQSAQTPRVYPRALRMGALILLGVFALVVVISTSASLGSYCVTSGTGTPAQP